ncbi:MAG: cellulase family glycosylhydrolase [Verrucomicrobia bacterium]|nr:cellulase family glycosylhydrolase [Verrucomicrobiota bacterium]
MKRREFLQFAASAAVTGLTTTLAAERQREQPAKTRISASKLPRWRGFNLLEKFTAERNAPFRESDFEWMAEWGFDFVRLPLSYRCWTDPNDWLLLKESAVKEIDQAVEFGRQYGIHVNLNFHRAPGYCVNPPKEPLDLWSDPKALEACAHHWAHFARRYKGIPSSQVSFDLLNEPAALPENTYASVVKTLVNAIRAEDPERLIIADGLRWGRDPVPSLVDLGLGQSTRGYDPMRISHYKASWVRGSDQWPVPTWPLVENEKSTWDRARLKQERIDPWQKLECKGVGIHVGEWGAFQHTPHKVVLAWMRDCLELWKDAGWGWAMWNLRGSFGFLDSNRKDVTYENFRGRKLDREMLELIRGF